MEIYVCNSCNIKREIEPGMLAELIQEQFCSLKCMIYKLSEEKATEVSCDHFDLHERQNHDVDY